MKRKLIWVVGLLMASQLLAGVPGQRVLTREEVAQLQQELGIKFQEKVAKDLLFFEVPDGMLPGPHELEVAYSVRGTRHFVERLAFDVEKASKGQVIELLVWHPEKRAEILALGEDPGNQVKVSIKLDGVRVQTFPLQRLRDRTEIITGFGFTPLVTRLVQDDRGGDVIARLFPKNQEECRAGCYEQYDACRADCDYGCYVDRICERQFDECYYYGCPPDCQPTTRTYSRRVILQQYPVSQACIEDYRNPFWGGKVYTEFYTYERIENHQETRNCDGTTTDVITSSFYNQYYCWAITGGSCGPYYAFNPAMRICY